MRLSQPGQLAVDTGDLHYYIGNIMPPVWAKIDNDLSETFPDSPGAPDDQFIQSFHGHVLYSARDERAEEEPVQ
jgi:hypothetical protein